MALVACFKISHPLGGSIIPHRGKKKGYLRAPAHEIHPPLKKAPNFKVGAFLKYLSLAGVKSRHCALNQNGKSSSNGGSSLNATSPAPDGAAALRGAATAAFGAAVRFLT